MLVVSDVHISVLESGLTVMPSGSMPTEPRRWRRALKVEHGHHRVVLVGDVENFTRRIRELFGIRTRRQIAGAVEGFRVKDLDDVVVAERDVDQFAVVGDLDAARALPGLDGCDGLHLVGVDHGDGIALFVGNIGKEGGSGSGRER